MASKRGIDNPYGSLTDYPEPDSFEFDPTKLSPEEQKKAFSKSADVDDAFEGKKLTDLEQWDKKSKAGGKKHSAPKKAPRQMIPRSTVQTPYGIPQSQLNKMSPGMYRQLLGMASQEGAMRTPPSAMQRLGQGIVHGLGGPGVRNMAAASGKAAGRVFPPAALALATRDIYEGVQEPGFVVGMRQLLGGEEAAYNAWAAQQAEMGIEVPSYEEYVAQKAAMEAGEMPDTREVARRALAPRYEQEMGPEDME